MTAVKVAIYNRKGGTGKTTLTLAIAAACRRVDAGVVVADCDPAGQLAAVAGEWTNVVRGVPPDSMADGNALILLDCPPDDEKARPALEAADLVLIPVPPEPLGVRGVAQAVQDLPAGTPYGVIVNFMRVEAVPDLEALTETLGDRLWLPPIPRRQALVTAQRLGVPVTEIPRRPFDLLEAVLLLTARLLAWTPPLKR